MVEKIEKFLKETQTTLAALKTRPTSTNADKIKLYSDSELFLIELEELLQIADLSDLLREQLLSLKKDLDAFSKSLTLNYATSPFGAFRLVDRFDELIRIVSVLLFLVSNTFLISLPCLLLKPLDKILVEFGILDSKHQLTVYARRFYAHSLLKLAGIHLVVEGDNDTIFGSECSLVCFSHVSTLDAFIVTATIPVHHISMVGCCHCNTIVRFPIVLTVCV